MSFCGNQVQLINVHGHYQWPVCKTNSLPCCDGDNCNIFFTWEEKADDQNLTTNNIPD